MKTIDERSATHTEGCESCGGKDICTCPPEEYEPLDVDLSEDDYGYPFEASYGRLNMEWCDECQDFIESPHSHIDPSSGHAEGW